MADQFWDYERCPPLVNIAHHTVLLEVATFCMVTWGLAWVGLSVFQPLWYQKLHTHTRNRNYVVGLLIGLGFKIITLPSCALSAYLTLPENDVAGIHPSMNDWQQVCWGSRGSTVFLELFHYIGNVELLIHHGLVLLAMTIIGVFDGPHRGLDMALGALISEYPSMTFSFLNRIGVAAKYPTLGWILLVAGAVLTLAIRVPAIFIGMAMIPSSGLVHGAAHVVLVAYMYYLVYNFNISWRRLRKAKVCITWYNKDGWDFGIRVARNTMVSSTAFFAGLATLLAQVLGLAAYSTFEFATKMQLIYAAYLSLPFLLIGIHVLQLEGRWKRWVGTSMSFLASTEWPNLGVVGRWTIGCWMLYIVVLAMLGLTPESYNKHLDPVDVVARSPAFCKLILSWEFWLCATVTLFLPMAGVQAQMSAETRADTTESQLNELLEKEKHTPDMQLQL